MVAVVQGVGVEQERGRSEDAQHGRGERYLRTSGSDRIAGLVVTRGAKSRDRKHERSECRVHRGEPFMVESGKPPESEYRVLVNA
jgi:hypothetical protein